MSEKRFYITDTGLGLDTVSDEMYSFGDEEDFCRLFDKLNEQQATISALKEENEHLQESYEICKKMLSETIEENELLECKWGVYNVHRLKKDYEQLKKENEKIQEEIKELKIERDDWKSSTCSYMKKDSILSMDCQIVQEALWELEKEIEFGSKREDLFFDLKEKFEKLNNHRIGVL